VTLFHPPDLFAPALARGDEPLVFWNRFVAGVGTALAVGSGGVTLRYELREPPAPQSWCLRLRLALPGGAVDALVVPRRFPFREIAGVELDAADLGALPAELRGAIVSGMLASVWRAAGLDLDALPQPREEGTLAAVAGAAGLEWLGLTLEGAAPAPVELLAGVRRGDLVRALEAQPPGPAMLGPLSGSVEVPVDLTAGRIDLTLAELLRIGPGDVAVLATVPATELHIRAGQIRFVFTQGEGGWVSSGPVALPRRRPRTLLQPLETAAGPSPAASQDHADQEDPMSDATIPDDAAGEAEGPPLRIDDLTLGVDFDLGRVSVPYSTLSTWTRGTVVPLSPPSTEPGVAVTIRINGDVVGTGDIVRIDDRLGVRITRLSAPTR